MTSYLSTPAPAPVPIPMRSAPSPPVAVQQQLGLDVVLVELPEQARGILGLPELPDGARGRERRRRGARVARRGLAGGAHEGAVGLGRGLRARAGHRGAPGGRREVGRVDVAAEVGLVAAALARGGGGEQIGPLELPNRILAAEGAGPAARGAAVRGRVAGDVARGAAAAAALLEVVQGHGAVATRVVADGRARALGVQARAKGLDVELVVRVDLLDDARPDAQDLEHAGRGAAEDDDGEHHHDEDGGLERELVLAREQGGQRDADGPAETRPEEHGLVVVRQLVLGLDAAAAGAVAEEPVERLGEREDGDPARRADGDDGDDDERRVEVERVVGEERQAEVDEDEVLGQLGHDLKDELGRELRAARHVEVGVVLERDAAEQERHDTWGDFGVSLRRFQERHVVTLPDK